MGFLDKLFKNMGKAGNKGWDEGIKVLTKGKNPLISANDIKKSLMPKGRAPKIPNSIIGYIGKKLSGK